MILGLTMLIFGSKFVVENALAIADIYGFAQSFVGVLIIGVGTGLPELSTALKGILRKAQGISLGTLIGSNITDPMLSLGSGALLSGFLVDKNLLYFDIPYWFFVTSIALILLKSKMRIGKEDRRQGMILISLYIIFLFLKIRFFR
jgi:cation:H+ antiporter